VQRQQVTSSNISSVGYDLETNTLEIEFSSGSVYQYSRVPEAVFRGLMAAASHGSYFNQHIRDHYSCRQIH
jgi:hypothetical protein